MKTNSFTYTIEEPCSESWNKMSSSEQGRFCMSCQKQVIDFSSMTDAEIINVINKATENVCGRFRNTQLNRPMQLSHNLQKPSSLRTILAGVVLLTVLTSSPEISASSLAPIAQQSNLSLFQKKPVLTIADTSTHIYKGRVLSEADSMPAVRAYVYFENTGSSVYTDSMGRFELPIPDSLIDKQIILQVDYVSGGQRNYISLNGIDYMREHVIYIAEKEMDVGKIQYTKGKVRRRVK